MYKDILLHLGLSPNEAIIYEFLLKNGESLAGEIIKKTPLKRGVVYNTLTELLSKDLVVERKKKRVAVFSPNHPEKLREYVELRDQELEKAKNTLTANLPGMISDFSLVSGKPGIKYYEGLKGIQKILDNSLLSHETIYSFADVEAVMTHINDINTAYVAKRDALGIKKQVIIRDSQVSREFLRTYHEKTTFCKFIDHELYPFNSILQIYDNKISYVTLTEKTKIGVLIEDSNIYQMQKSIFQFVWDRALTYDELKPLSKTQ